MPVGRASICCGKRWCRNGPLYDGLVGRLRGKWTWWFRGVGGLREEGHWTFRLEPSCTLRCRPCLWRRQLLVTSLDRPVSVGWTKASEVLKHITDQWACREHVNSVVFRMLFPPTNTFKYPPWGTPWGHEESHTTERLNWTDTFNYPPRGSLF